MPIFSSRPVTSAYLRWLDDIKLIYNFFLVGMMQNDIPNTYTSKKRGKTFWKGPNKSNNLGQLTGRLPKFYFTSERLNCIPQNRQCHQILTMYFSSSRIYRSFTGKRQHFETRNAGDFVELSVELHFLYCFSYSSRACYAPCSHPLSHLPQFSEEPFTSAPPSITRYNKLRFSSFVSNRFT